MSIWWSGGYRDSADHDKADWLVRINHAGRILTNLVITDNLNNATTNETYIPGSFLLRKVTMDAIGDIQSYDATINLAPILTFSPDNKSFTIQMGNIVNDS